MQPAKRTAASVKATDTPDFARGNMQHRSHSNHVRAPLKQPHWQPGGFTSTVAYEGKSQDGPPSMRATDRAGASGTEIPHDNGSKPSHVSASTMGEVAQQVAVFVTDNAALRPKSELVA